MSLEPVLRPGDRVPVADGLGRDEGGRVPVAAGMSPPPGAGGRLGVGSGRRRPATLGPQEDNGVRLVVTGGPWSVWSRLEPETTAERVALEACTARGERISGSGVDAITPLRALAARLGYPIEALDPRVTASPSPRLVVVRRGEPTLYARLTTMARAGLTVIWDRRQGERRTIAPPSMVDRRRRDRRGPSPPTWAALGFLMVPYEVAPQS